MIETSSFDTGEWKVRFLGTAKFQPYNLTYSVFSNAYAFIHRNETVFVGAGTGLDLILHPDLREGNPVLSRNVPVSIFLPNVDQSMVEGLASSSLILGMHDQLTLHIPGIDGVRLDTELREKFDCWERLGVMRSKEIKLLLVQKQNPIPRTRLSLTSEKMCKRITKTGKTVFYCALPSRNGTLMAHRSVAFRIGNTVIAPAGGFTVHGGYLPARCKQLLQNASHLVIGYSEEPGNGCSTPEEIVLACMQAGCRPSIYLVNHACVNVRKVAERLQEEYSRIKHGQHFDSSKRVFIGVDALFLQR